MTFRTIGIILSVLATLWATGCGGPKKGKFSDDQMRTIPLANRYDLPAASGGMTISLYSETVTSEEILLALEERLRPTVAQTEQQAFVAGSMPLIRDTVRSKVADILLYAEARKKAPSNIDTALDKAVDQEINRFVAGYGNNYALAEADIRKMGMDWRTFREYQKKLLMTHSYLSGKLNTTIRFTHSEMIAHYDKVRSEQFCRSGTLEFHAIDIVPGLLSADRIDDGQSAKDAGVQLAAAIAARARAGDDFAELARNYSQGPLARSGGKWLPVTIGANALPKPYDILETEALKLEPGQISDPIINADHIFVLKLDRKDLGGCKSFTEVQPLVEQQLLFQYRKTQYEKYIGELIKQVDFVEMERFSEFCANAAYERWKKAS
jgi:hypothetical protein